LWSAREKGARRVWIAEMSSVIAAYNRMYRPNSVNCSKDPRGQIPKKHLDQKLAKKSGLVSFRAANIDNSNVELTTS
jgi:hypothetical protein